MSLVLSAIVPHAPILIPAIGQENLKRLKATTKSYQLLRQKIIDRQVDTIIVISPHGTIQENIFTMNLCPEFIGTFESFGDLTTKKTWLGDVGLAYKIRENLETRAPLQLISEEKLDHGTSIPLYLLTDNLSQIKIIPIYYSGLSHETHFEFGKMIKNQLLIERKNIAVIASGDLSHRLSKDAPAGYSPKAKAFDRKLIKYLLKNKNQDIINFKPDFVNEAGECGLRSILILLGILSNVNHKAKLLSYETPFGVGYMSMDFII